MSAEALVKAKATSPPSVTHVSSGLLQRKCACGGSPVAGGECAECQKKRLDLQRREADNGGTRTAPPIVHEVLRSSGRPLDESTRTLLEPRLGHDFSRVRVHTDSQAAESTRAVGALAYTVGQDIAFGAGQYDPSSSAGLLLLSHELVHVVQQTKIAGSAPSSFQLSRANGANAPDVIMNQLGDHFEREADRVAKQVLRMPDYPLRPRPEPTGAWRPGSSRRLGHNLEKSGGEQLLQRFVACEPEEQCPPRAAGEAGRADRDPMLVRSVSSPTRGLVVGNFTIGGNALKSSLARSAIWSDFLAQMVANTDLRWEILGFTDCRGSERLNRHLRQGRAEALRDAMPAQHRAQLDQVSAAPLADCLSDDTDEQGRALNRSALVRLRSQEVTVEEEIITARLCGPDVTNWLIEQMKQNQNHPVIRTGRENHWPRWVPVFNIGWTGAALYDFADLVGPGKPWDFKRTQPWWRADSSGACPTSNCDRTVTLCGNCVNYDVPGNIHFGWVGRRMELAPWALHFGAGSVQEGGARGDDPPDTVAINIGIGMADEGKTLCGEVRGKLAQLNLDRAEGCSLCEV